MTARSFAARPAAKPARFAADPRKRGMLAKLHIAKKELALEDADYRAILDAETGKHSAAELSFAEIGRVLDRLKAKGWQPSVRPASEVAPARHRQRRADHASAKKARALWISLHQLGVVRNPAESALQAFARRQLHVEQLQWANGAHCYQLIEALKAMAGKAGWDQAIDEPGRRLHNASDVLILKRRLAIAQAAKLDGYVNDHCRATIRQLNEPAVETLIAEQAARIHDAAETAGA